MMTGKCKIQHTAVVLHIDNILLYIARFTVLSLLKTRFSISEVSF